MSDLGQKEDRMVCLGCRYRLSEKERILCRVGGQFYCPKCWGAIAAPSDVIVRITTGVVGSQSHGPVGPNL